VTPNIREDVVLICALYNKNVCIEDMEVIRKKLIDIKRSTYSGKNKCNNRQIKSTGNERRLSSKRQSVPKDSMDVEVLPESRLIHIKKEQANKNM
jgi:hypothetical protein